MSNNNDDGVSAEEVVFEYAGEECAVPTEVTIVRFQLELVHLIIANN